MSPRLKLLSRGISSVSSPIYARLQSLVRRVFFSRVDTLAVGSGLRYPNIYAAAQPITPVS